jgi:putative DeoR family transcriptional regulator (stage III sporulation protein D)
MQQQLVQRIIKEAKHVIQTGDTVRATAKVFLFSKSTVHKDVTERLEKIDKELYQKVQKVLEKNLAERHIRGGEATRVKYLKNRTQK